MKQLRPFPQVTITSKGARFLGAGNVWVYAGEVLGMAPAPATGREAQNGDVVDVVDEKGTYLGTGLLSLNSLIRVRIISRNANDRFDQAFWERKARWAWEYRKNVLAGRSIPGNDPDTSCCRLIFSEADSFGGLIVDRYGDVLVAETLTAGMDRLRPVVFDALLAALAADGQHISGIYERNDAKTREKEGLPLVKGWFRTPEGQDAIPRRVVAENGVLYDIDFENGQKTGFFLDQKYNRRAVARLAEDRRVLDCFTHVGTFALNCAKAGAALAHGIDVSQLAIDQCQVNARLNGLEANTRFTCANVFDVLQAYDEDRSKLADAGGPFDLIVLDPPAFTKNRKTIHEAARGYRQINYRAMRLLPRGGYLATCSCSHFMDEALLSDVIRQAAHDAGVQLRQVERRQQAPDHPIVWGIPETSYLDFLIFQVI